MHRCYRGRSLFHLPSRPPEPYQASSRRRRYPNAWRGLARRNQLEKGGCGVRVALMPWEPGLRRALQARVGTGGFPRPGILRTEITG